MAKTYKGITIEFGANTSSLSKALNSVDAQSKNLNASLKSVNELLKLDPKNTEFLEKKQKLLAQTVEVTTKRLKVLKEAEDQVEKQFKNGDIGLDEYTSFNKELIKTKQKLESVKQEQESLSGKVKNTNTAIGEMGNTSVKTGDIMKANLASEAIVSGLKAIANGAKELSKAIVQVGSDFEASMSQVAATMGIDKTTADYKKLEQSAKDMGATTKYTASEAADALNYLALAGYDANKATETLPKILTLAQAGGMDIATTSDLVTDAMGQLQMETSELDTFIDQMAKTSQKSNTNVQQLGEAFLTVGGAAVTTGQDVDKVSTALGILANNGKKGEEGGTALRNILLSLTAPTAQAEAELKNLGVSVADSKGNIKDINVVMSELNKSLAGMSESSKTQALSTIFNKRDLSGVQALLASTNGEFSKLYEEIKNSSGAAEQMADTMNDNLKGRLAETKSVLEAIGIASYEKFQEPLKSSFSIINTELGKFKGEISDGELGKSFEDLGDSLGDFVENGIEVGEKVLPKLISCLTWIMDNANIIAGALAGITAKMITQSMITTVVKTAQAFQALTTATQTATVAQEGLNVAQSANPIGLIATGIGTVIGLLVTYATTADDASEKVSKFKKENDALIESLEAEKKSFDENISSIEDEYNGYQKLSKQLYDLQDKEKLTNKEKQTMVQLVDMLNEKFPNLNLQIDEHTGLLNKDKVETDKLISSTEEYCKLLANQDRLVENYKAQSTLETKIADDTSQIEEAQKQLNEANKKKKAILDEIKGILNSEGLNANDLNDEELYNQIKIKPFETFSNVGAHMAEKADLSKEYEKIIGQTDKYKKKVDELNESIEDNTKQHSKLEAEAVSLTKKINGVSDETKNLGNGLNKTSADAEQQAERLEELQNEYTKWSNAVNTTKSEISDLVSIQNALAEGQEYSTIQILDMIEKYPELIGNIKATKEGYIIEQEAIENLIKVRVANLQLMAKEQTLSAQRIVNQNGMSNNELKSITNLIDNGSLTDLAKYQSDEYTDGLYEYLTSYSYQKGLNNIVNDIMSSGIKNGKTSTNTSTSSNVSSSSSASQSTTDTWKEEAENQISYINHLHNMKQLSDEQYYNELDKINKKYYANSNKYIKENWALEEQVFQGRQSLAEKEKQDKEKANQEEKEAYEKQAENYISDLKHRLKMGEISTENYYKKLDRLNRKYYGNKKEYAKEYQQIEEEINDGMEQAQKDNLDYVMNLYDKTNDLIEAQNKLTNAKQTKVRVFSSASGWHYEGDTETINEANDSVFDAQRSLGNIISDAKSNSNISMSMINKVLNNLPDLLGITVPNTNSVNNTTNNKSTTNNTSYNFNIGEVKSDNPEQFAEQMRHFITSSNLDRIVGK